MQFKNKPEIFFEKNNDNIFWDIKKKWFEIISGNLKFGIFKFSNKKNFWLCYCIKILNFF